MMEQFVRAVLLLGFFCIFIGYIFYYISFWIIVVWAIIAVIADIGLEDDGYDGPTTPF